MTRVCKRWRANSLYLLFKYAVWELDHWDLYAVEPGQERDPLQNLPFLRFLADNNLARRVDSLTIIVRNDQHLEYEDSNALNFGPTLGHPRGGELAHRSVRFADNHNWVWGLLFSMMDPFRITFVAPPYVLGNLFSCESESPMSLTDPPFLFSFYRATKEETAPPPPDAFVGINESVIGTICTWTAMLYNKRVPDNRWYLGTRPKLEHRGLTPPVPLSLNLCTEIVPKSGSNTIYEIVHHTDSSQGIIVRFCFALLGGIDDQPRAAFFSILVPGDIPRFVRAADGLYVTNTKLVVSFH